MAFKVGDLIAHPLHGAGVISGIEQRRINGCEQNFYMLHIPVGNITVMIPTDSCEKIGIRPIVDSKRANDIMRSIPDIKVSDNQNWNKRYRENMLKIRSGDLLEVATVIKSLVQRDNERGLSTGERKMLHSAKQILISELVLSQGSSYEEAELQLSGAIN